MAENEYAKVIAKNLKRIAYEHQKSQADIARDLNIKQATLSSWMTGNRVPRMKMVDRLCNYFNCSRADIMGEKEPGEMGRTAALESVLLNKINYTANQLTDEGKARLLLYAEKLYDLQLAEEELK